MDLNIVVSTTVAVLGPVLTYMAARGKNKRDLVAMENDRLNRREDRTYETLQQLMEKQEKDNKALGEKIDAISKENEELKKEILRLNNKILKLNTTIAELKILLKTHEDVELDINEDEEDLSEIIIECISGKVGS